MIYESKLWHVFVDVVLNAAKLAGKIGKGKQR
jgi:hypothetical protein